jgi:hypothetical protein
VLPSVARDLHGAPETIAVGNEIGKARRYAVGNETRRAVKALSCRAPRCSGGVSPPGDGTCRDLSVKRLPFSENRAAPSGRLTSAPAAKRALHFALAVTLRALLGVHLQCGNLHALAVTSRARHRAPPVAPGTFGHADYLAGGASRFSRCVRPAGLLPRNQDSSI